MRLERHCGNCGSDTVVQVEVESEEPLSHELSSDRKKGGGATGFEGAKHGVKLHHEGVGAWLNVLIRTHILGSPARQDLLCTFLTEGFVMVALLAAFRLASALLPGSEYGIYLLGRRAVALTSATLLFGMGIGVARYVSLSRDKRTAVSYLYSAIAMTTGVLSLYLVVTAMFPTAIGRVIFDREASSRAVAGVAASVCGLCFHIVTYGYFRGSVRMWAANALQLVNGAAAPLIAIALSGGRADRTLFIHGIVTGVVAVAALGISLSHSGAASSNFGEMKQCSQELVVFGMPRVVAEFCWFGFFSVPTFMVARRFGIDHGAGLSLGFSMMQVVTGAFSALGLVLLPRVGRLLAAGNVSRVRRVVGTSVSFSLAIGACLVIVGMVLSRWALEYFSGSRYTNQLSVVRWVLCAAIPCLVYTVLRQPLDAVSVAPLNAINLLIAFAVLMGSLQLCTTPASVGYAVFGGFAVLAILSGVTWRGRSARLEAAASTG